MMGVEIQTVGRRQLREDTDLHEIMRNTQNKTAETTAGAEVKLSSQFYEKLVMSFLPVNCPTDGYHPHGVDRGARWDNGSCGFC